jgi:hypothetical protein
MSSSISFLTSRRGLVASFALFCALFQIYVLAQSKAFYPVLRVLFVVLMVQLAAAFIGAARKQPLLWLAVLMIVAVRVPFYLHSDGAMVTSDNACDGLQAVEMRDTHTAPHFLLGAVKHMGTIKYVMVAFLMDVIGNTYLAYLLIQTLLFIVVLFTLYELFKTTLSPPALFVFLFLTQFAFMEVIFDFSLSLRGAPYLEMLFFVILGVGLIDPEFRAKGRTFLGYYFLFYSIYIHPLGAILVGCFGLVFLVYSVVRRRFWTHAGLAAAGLAAGLYHWFYYLLYLPKPVANGGWEQIGILPLNMMTPAYLREYARILKEIFTGLFNFEFSYMYPYFHDGRTGGLAPALNGAAIFVSLAVTAVGVFLAFRTILRLLRRRQTLQNADWPYLFAGVLTVIIAVKALLFFPKHVEPRHNFDLAFLIMLSYFIVFSRIIRIDKIRSWKSAVVFGLAVIAAIPHVATFFQVVRGKDAAYYNILRKLDGRGVRYLTTDFIVAYPIYFLSGRKIHVTDSLGPFMVRDFFPAMRVEVDAVPPDQKAYIFLSEEAANRPVHKINTRYIYAETVDMLRREGILFRTYKLHDYIILIPRRRS